MPDAPQITPADRAIVEAAEDALRHALHWQASDRAAAIRVLYAALPLVADSIEQSAHDPGSGGEIYVLVREAKRLRALAARLAEAGNE